MNGQYQDYKIAFLGKSGVGKSSLINMLFDLGLPVNAVEECTKNAVATWVRNHTGIQNSNCDSFMVIDTPGISAALENDEFYMPFYHHVLSLTDCMVWVVQGNTRSDRQDQEMLLRLKPLIGEKMKKILCVNMVDKIGSGYQEDWDKKTGLPNQKMENLIKQRCDDLIKKFSEVNFYPNEVIPCAASKKYNLERLLSAIIYRKDTL